ncbi:type VI secretion lipoprotein, VC_A0113 family [Pseudomonas reinekei]|uniref:Type VI secretion lipoprotein, VC_A0113 family n=1 Tax=Pseudomonas reinekei TaxID=395598 RepID=A0A1H0HEC0_PSERE|nr:type VI secretion system lipoprotein TssJ [Pseudomonas reinekei]KAB0479788.1 type VI secretion system lipoprotein TssJ [Pseudomonas reinekei]OLT98770.1 type VI secretion system-associated lipoprotein [Pseudomonas reinekei]SDO17515.1 type VI secretion lipoprotein, VC_A0113 family [Pseudomonas reinekei]
MKLTLVINNPAQLLHGYLPLHRFGPQGGSIGSAAADWRLEDRHNSVQPNHCEIRVVEGCFCVIDRSGRTYANGHDLPLGRNVAVSLNDGDVLQIGAYRVAVQLGEHAPGQRSLNELFSGQPEGMQAWHLEDLPSAPLPDPRPAICAEFERLCQPVDLTEQGDPLRVLEAAPLPKQPPEARPTVAKRPSTLFSNLRLGTLLLACLTLGGCTMLGKIGQVIWTPSIPVGGPDDQPSRYSLSLHASDDVNPRLISTGTAPDEDASRSPYTLNVQATSPQALTDKVQTLLSHLYESVPAQSPLSEEPATVVPMSPIEDALLGDYDAQGVSLTTPWGNPALAHVATPIALKVLQLTDDSLLFNASPQAMAEDLKKTLGSTYIRADDYLLNPGQFKFIELRALDEDTRFIAVIANYHNTDVGQWKQRLRVEPKGRQYAVLVQLDAAQVSLKEETR